MLFCAGLALVGAIVSVNLWRELRAERALTAELRQQRGESGPAMARVPDATATAASMAPASASPAASASDEAATPTQGNAAPPPIVSGATVASFISDQQEMMKDPEYRKARLAQTRLTLPQSYPGLVEALGLSPEEADKLYDLLAEQQLEMSTTSMLVTAVGGTPPDPAAIQDAARRSAELQRRHDEALMATLGGRYPQWQDYQQTRGARQQVVQVGRTMEAAGFPLTAEQSRPLTDVYITEQRRQREETMQMMASARTAGPLDQARMLEERLKLQADSNQRILDAARPHLNAQQLNALQTSMEQQLVMNRASSRMARQRLESGEAAAPATSVNFIAVAPAQSAPPPAP